MLEDLRQVKKIFNEILLEVESTLNKKQPVDYNSVLDKYQKLIDFSQELNKSQVERIVTEESKTRLSILYYAIIGNFLAMSKQNLRLLEIFQESFGKIKA